jgi:predicted nucleic acid-binding protein
MSLTVDASVFIASARTREPNYSESYRFVDRLDRDAITLTCPTLLIAECAAAISRVTGDAFAADDLLAVIDSLPGIELLALTTERARAAAVIGVRNSLRGADAIYAQAAHETRATLITWDNEMLTRASGLLSVLTPADWLAENPEPTIDMRSTERTD